MEMGGGTFESSKGTPLRGLGLLNAGFEGGEGGGGFGIQGVSLTFSSFFFFFFEWGAEGCRGKRENKGEGRRES